MIRVAPENMMRFSYGHPFGKAAYIFVALLIFVGFGFCVNGLDALALIGIIFIASGILIATFSHGLLIDTAKKKYCFYGPIQQGKWKDISPYTDLCLLTKRYSSTLSYKGAININQSDSFKEVYLMDKFHLKRLYLETISDHVNHEKRLKELAEKLGVTVSTFNPVTRRNLR